MKKIHSIVLSIVATVMFIAAVISVLYVGFGNRQIIDLTKTFERAILMLPDGDIIEGKVSSWKDFDDGDQIQVKIDGKTYLVHSSDVVLISE